MQKELAVLIKKVIDSAKEMGDVRDFYLTVGAPEVEGFTGTVQFNMVKLAEPVAAPKVVKAKKHETAGDADTVPNFKDQPIEVCAALLALKGPQPNYVQEDIKEAIELLSSDESGNVHELASDILAMFQDCNNPVMLNTALVSVGGFVVEWWDELADHAARVDFFNLLKLTKSNERDTVQPVIYATDGAAPQKFEGKGSLAAFKEFAEGVELAGSTVKVIDAKEFAKGQKKEKAPDLKKLRDEGLALVREKASAHRDAITKVLTDFKAINPDTDKPSWGFVPDDQVVGAVAALKAL